MHTSELTPNRGISLVERVNSLEFTFTYIGSNSESR
jgi:hypothetical protein